jgi:hypothetical protein
LGINIDFEVNSFMQKLSYRLGISAAMFILLSLACSLPQLGEDSARVEPTRTPFPTFTPTVAVEAQISIPPTPAPTEPPPTETPAPEPTEPPAPPPTEEAEPTPEPTATPVPPPTEPPPPPAPEPTEPPPPPEPVAPAAPNGVEGNITFRDGRNTYAVGERVFVNIEAKNVESGLKNFGILGLAPSTGGFQSSWTDGSIGAGETFRWEDGVAFPAPGTHRLYLSICFSDQSACQGPDGNWVRFEPGLEVIIQ